MIIIRSFPISRWNNFLFFLWLLRFSPFPGGTNFLFFLWLLCNVFLHFQGKYLLVFLVVIKVFSISRGNNFLFFPFRGEITFCFSYGYFRFSPFFLWLLRVSPFPGEIASCFSYGYWGFHCFQGGLTSCLHIVIKVFTVFRGNNHLFFLWLLRFSPFAGGTNFLFFLCLLCKVFPHFQGKELLVFLMNIIRSFPISRGNNFVFLMVIKVFSISMGNKFFFFPFPWEITSYFSYGY